VERPTLGSEVRIGWRHYRNYKDHFMDLLEMLIKLKIARKNTAHNWTFNEMASVDDNLQTYLVCLDPSRASASDETDMPEAKRSKTGERTGACAGTSWGRK
jgi:hypothetical protein